VETVQVPDRQRLGHDGDLDGFLGDLFYRKDLTRVAAHLRHLRGPTLRRALLVLGVHGSRLLLLRRLRAFGSILPSRRATLAASLMLETTPISIPASAVLRKEPTVSVCGTAGRGRNSLLLVALVASLAFLCPHVLVPDVLKLTMSAMHAVATNVG
jgi:hypothetical protein